MKGFIKRQLKTWSISLLIGWLAEQLLTSLITDVGVVGTLIILTPLVTLFAIAFGFRWVFTTNDTKGRYYNAE